MTPPVLPNCSPRRPRPSAPGRAPRTGDPVLGTTSRPLGVQGRAARARSHGGSGPRARVAPLGLARAAALAAGLALLALAPRPAAADDREVPEAARVGYWLERLQRGPEPMQLALPNFHQGALADAQTQLARMADATLERLADPALRERLLHQPDTNPWHGLLTVLARVGGRRPDVARAWARPALTHPDRVMRVAGVSVLAALAAPEDGPDLLEVLRREPGDRMLASTAATVLVGLGAPWDGRAARVALAEAPDDGAAVGSTAWAAVVLALRGSTAPSRDDVLAALALHAEASGPGAPWPPGRRPAWVVAPPAALFRRGAVTAAVARARLAEAGHAAYVARVAADVASDDPDLAAIARNAAQLDAAGAATLAARVEAMLAAFGRHEAVPPDALDALVGEVRARRPADAAATLVRFLDAVPADPAYADGLLRAFDGVRKLGVEPLPSLARHLASGDRTRIDFVLRCVRRTDTLPYVDLVEAWLGTPAAATARGEGRRALAFLYAGAAAKGQVPAERQAAFADTLAGWGEDETDPSAAGLLGGLLDLGPAGEARLARGLASGSRARYVTVLEAQRGRVLGADVIAALLAGLGPGTPTDARRSLWNAVFAVAGADAVPALEAASAGLPRPLAAEGAPILRMVRHRAPRR